MEILQPHQENKSPLNTYSFEFVTGLQNKIEELETQVAWFKEQFKLANQRQFGKSSEAILSMNLSLFDEKITADDKETIGAPIQEESITYTRKKKSTGRHFDISRFPKEQTIHDLEESEKVCHCGNQLIKAGEDSSIQVDHIPETFKVIEHITLKYCCRQCETIKSAKKPETAIPKCMATAGFVAEVITKKYEQHLPLYRQSKIFEKLGAAIPDNTLGHWVMRAADALLPLGVASREQLQQVHLLQSDDTKVKTIKPNKEGYLWGYHSCDPGNRFIFFEYSSSRSATLPNETLKGFTGLLQTDGYSGYNDLRKKPAVVSLGCWDHCRRKFTDVVKVADKERKGKAAQLLVLINRLYEIEREAKEMNVDARKIYRQEKAKPVLDLLYEDISKIQAPPKSLLGVATTYALNQRPYLIAYLNYGEVPISNCWIENQIRPFAVGRRYLQFIVMLSYIIKYISFKRIKVKNHQVIIMNLA